MRREYKLTPEELSSLIFDTPLPSLPMPAGPALLWTDGRVEAKWKLLGSKYGFITETRDPIPGKGAEWFTAEEVTA